MHKNCYLVNQIRVFVFYLQKMTSKKYSAKERVIVSPTTEGKKWTPPPFELKAQNGEANSSLENAAVQVRSVMPIPLISANKEKEETENDLEDKNESKETGKTKATAAIPPEEIDPFQPPLGGNNRNTGPNPIIGQNLPPASTRSQDEKLFSAPSIPSANPGHIQRFSPFIFPSSENSKGPKELIKIFNPSSQSQSQEDQKGNAGASSLEKHDSQISSLNTGSPDNNKNDNSSGGGKEAPQGESAGGGGADAEISEVKLDASSMGSVVKSMGSQSPLGLISGMKTVGQAFSEGQIAELDQAKESLPEIDQPTGLPTRTQHTKPKDQSNLETKPSTEIGPSPAEGEPKQQIIETELPKTPLPAEKVARPHNESLNQSSGFMSAISSLPAGDSSVNTNLGPKPKLQLKGEADPAQNQKAQETADQELDTQKNQADSEIQKDFGENDIFPEIELETLSPSVEFTKGEIPSPLEQPLPSTSPEILANFDKEAQPFLEQESGPELAKQEEAEQKMKDDQLQAHLENEQEIATETEKVKNEQESAQLTAKADIEGQRNTWQSENEAVKQEFASKSAKEREKINKDIDNKTQEVDSQVEKSYADAKSNADAKVKETNKEAAKRKQEAKKKSKKKGWFRRAIDAVGNFFDKIKEGLNKLFDGLRKMVKTIIDKAKKLASYLIDKARNAIVGLIKAFGNVLKGFINIALAAFPKLRDKFNALIDKAVDRACDLVNKLAEGLKTLVNKLLDALGAVLDSILAAYQAVLNLIIDALKLLTVGLLKILEGLANLGKSAMEMPGNFWGQISEEFLGMDVTAPLPFERSTPYGGELAAPTADAGNDMFSEYANRGSYTPEDFMVEEVISDLVLPDNLLAQISALSEGGELEFGQNSEETMEHLQGTSGGLPEEALDFSGMENQMEMGMDSGGGGMSLPPELYGNNRGQIDWFIGQQGGGMNENIPDSAGNQKAAGQNDIPPAMRVLEPLSVGDRLYYLRKQMMSGIKKKWEENKAKYIGIGIAVVLGITALAIATGGAIFSLIPPALQIFAAIMGGAAVIKAGKFFKKFITEGWGGKIVEGGKALARSIGILLVELIFILLFDSVALLKVMKAGVKGSMKMAMNGAKNTVKAVGKGLKASGKGLVKTGGKVVTGVKGVGKGVGKGAKNLDDFAKRMMKKAKFKGFKIKRNGKRFQLFGSINPWVLLATGEIKEVKSKGGWEIGGRGEFPSKNGSITIKGQKYEINEGMEISESTKGFKNIKGQFKNIKGQKYKIKGKGKGESATKNRYITNEGKDYAIIKGKIYEIIEGILIGTGKKGGESKFVDGLKGNQNKAKEMFDELGRESSDHGNSPARKARIQNIRQFDYEKFVQDYGQKAADTYKGRNGLAKSLDQADKAPKDQAHHLIPVELIQRSALLRKAIEEGFDFNGPINGKWLKPYSSRKPEQVNGYHASHPQYTDNVMKKMDKEFDKFLTNHKDGPTNIQQLKEGETKIFMDGFAEQIDDMIEANIKSKFPVKLNDMDF